MSFATLFPLGMIQLYKSVGSGYFEARTLEFLTNDTNKVIEWIRFPGDVLFIVGGVLPLLYICWLGRALPRQRVTTGGARGHPLHRDDRAASRADGARRRDDRHVGSEALLAAGIRAVSVLAAAALDLAARHSHRRSDRYRTAGFTYHGHLDAWECPEGEHLRRVELDHQMRVARYRAKAHVCNACPSKADSAPTPTRAGRSSAPSTRGRTPRPGGFTAGSASLCSASLR